MDWIETLHLRSHRKSDRDAAVESFRQLSFPEFENRISEIVLLQDTILENDLLILIRWRAETVCTGKSPLGLNLAAAFAEFGVIDHNTWHSKCRIVDSTLQPGDWTKTDRK